MIRAEELRVGNLLKFDDESTDIVKVEYTFFEIDIWFIKWTKVKGDGNFKDGKSFLDDFEPIPITPEILEAAGLDKPKSTMDLFGNYSIYLEVDEDMNLFLCTEEAAKLIYYLHQLQNIYYSLKGKELTINLNAAV